ncbi:MAG TPA: FAD-binding oxidoreductase [Trichocoleus sp.]
MSLIEEILSPIPGNPLVGLRQADRLWQSYQADNLSVPHPIQESFELLNQTDWDAVICGGTLGILMGAALAQRGWRVALVERGILRGRDQEWNISRRELQVLIELGLLTEAELAQSIATEYNPACLRFNKGVELQVKDVLNIGVDPVFLLDKLKAKFLAAGGSLLEQTAFAGAVIHPNGVEVKVAADAQTAEISLKTRLLLDCMGHFSPIVRQARQGKKPDAVCLVVGTCAAGFPENKTGDLFASFTPIQNQCQYFWEAFPARDGRTTYLFTYLDAHPERPSLEQLFEDYLTLLPQYQGIELSHLTFRRALFGFFPCYQEPLQLWWNRVLAIGDSSGLQSPLSFGGFGSMMRHLKRLTEGVDAALQGDYLDRSALQQLQPYQPNLAVTWLFQRAMSVGIHQQIHPDQINALLSAVFQEMNVLGDNVLYPFLQDVIQFSALSQTLLRVAVTHPQQVIPVIPQVGFMTLLNWTIHYLKLGQYALLYSIAKIIQPRLKILPENWRYRFDRAFDAWRYGSGNDYSHD